MEQKEYRECVINLEDICQADRPAIYVLNMLKKAGFVMKGGKPMTMCLDFDGGRHVYRQEI